MKGTQSMHDMLISRRSDIEAEAKLRGVHPEVLATQLEQVIARVLGRALHLQAPESYGGSKSETSRRPHQDYIPKVMEINFFSR